MQDKNQKLETKSTLDIRGEQKVDMISHWLLVDIEQVLREKYLPQNKGVWESMEPDLYRFIQECIRMAYVYGAMSQEVGRENKGLKH